MHICIFYSLFRTNRKKTIYNSTGQIYYYLLLFYTCRCW